MASYGLIGAIGGAAQGFGNALQFELEESRKMRLEEVRAKNTRELNRENNQQRHEFSMTEMKQRDDNQNTLLQTSDTLARGRQADQNQWSLDNQDNSTAQNRQIDELMGRGMSQEEATAIVYPRATSDISSQGQQITDLVGLGLSQDEALAKVYPAKADDTKESYHRNLVMQLVKDGYDADDIESLADSVMSIAFREPQEPPPDAPETWDDLHRMIKDSSPGASDEDITEATNNRALSHFPHLMPDSGSPPAPAAMPGSDLEEPAPERGPKKYGASFDDILGVPGRALSGAVSDIAGSVTDGAQGFTQRTNAKVAYDNYRRVKGLDVGQIPLEVLENVLPYLDGKEAKEVQAAISALK